MSAAVLRIKIMAAMTLRRAASASLLRIAAVPKAEPASCGLIAFDVKKFLGMKYPEDPSAWLTRQNDLLAASAEFISVRLLGRRKLIALFKSRPNQAAWAFWRVARQVIVGESDKAGLDKAILVGRI